ncbi:MAG: leucine-rich repeat domain-containing protein [Spirochaetaceae bacterium]|jgi:hypothetical protein|nr:leucine-rich repeat domain-containing protein [Spirochaetaceae bacterium]
MTVRGNLSVIVLSLFCFCGPLSAQLPEPEQDVSGENEDFILLQNRSGGITITGYRGTEKTVEIPERFGGLPVTVIGNKAFFGKELSAVRIPKTVTVIEPLAFAGNQLHSLELPGVIRIGYEAFANNRLTQLSFSADLSSIGQRAFMNNRLRVIDIPGRVTNIGKDAFTGNSLNSITLGANRNIFASQGFEPSFVNYYTGTGRRAGVYVKDGTVWCLQTTDAGSRE